MLQKLNIIFLALSIYTSTAYGLEKIISVTTLDDYAPFCFLEGLDVIEKTIAPGENLTNFSGYSWDVLRESLHIMGYTIKLRVIPWSRALSDVEIGKADAVFPTAIDAERSKIFSFSNEYVNETKFLIYVSKDSQIKWTDLQSLAGFTIAVKRGFYYGKKWKEADYINKYIVGDVLQGFGMLDKQRIAGFLGYERNWDYILKHHGWASKYKKLPPFGGSKEYLATLKTNPRAKEFLTAFDVGKQKLIENGRLAKIHEKWFGETFIK
ncbi:substrate-binding periplasmic protein [Pseudoalteromonas denitrificans]|uniref:Amino acid ABC transporter substrate-binding protein, PAAT family n=1 Tax=Pseudoalteromonas denitrificans DSM 6059 TaxID=1123010 RepID=A0A1I1MSZ4_9GAMM|nr:transporter substrate-binding domain-containing protein [Pseudoalteromonas denitrificans]SFC88042.1 amino acid ABC transporter substrate-binding protein, PAAT family [Pseudoalteromonas denitrificans DSM 6059]